MCVKVIAGAFFETVYSAPQNRIWWGVGTSPSPKTPPHLQFRLCPLLSIFSGSASGPVSELCSAYTDSIFREQPTV